MVSNTETLDQESNAITTMPLLHLALATNQNLVNIHHNLRLWLDLAYYSLLSYY